MRLKIYVILALLVPAAAVALAAPADTVATRQQAVMEHTGLWSHVLGAAWTDPALHAHAYTTTYSDLHLYYDRETHDRAVVMQEGTALSAYGAEVTSYRQLGTRHTVWGEASYQQSRRKDVRWNETSDYRTVYPYVLADTLGGDMDGERYTFMGGCATRLGDRWTLGEEIAFRAEHEWRTRDPRPRAIVTDLNLRLAVAYAAWGYRLAAGASGRFYKQTNSVEFYRQEGVSPVYQMTGLGSDYVRFSGSNRQAYYKASGYGFDVAAAPADGHGAYLSASMSDTPIRRILSNLNAMPIAKLYVTRLSAEAGWKGAAWAAFAGMDYERRQGNELIAGSSSSTEYKEIGHLTMYRNHLGDYYAGGAWHREGRSAWTVTARAGWQDYTSSYVFPRRSFDFTKGYVRAEAEWQRHTGREVLIGVRAACTYYANTSDDVLLPLAAMDAARQQMAADATAAATASVLVATGSIRLDWMPRAWHGLGLFAALNGGACHTTDRDNEGSAFRSALGLTF